MLFDLIERVKLLIRSGNKIEWESYLLILGKYNPITNTIYSVNNSLSLDLFKDNDKYVIDENIDPRYSTFLQLKQRGYKLKVGVKGKKIYFFIKDGIFNLTSKHPLFDKVKHQLLSEEMKIIEQGGAIKRSCKVHKSFYVFNYQDVENPPKLENNFRQIDVDNLMLNCKVNLIHKITNKASYNRKEHSIIMPVQNQFRSKESYYATLLHEFSHWTSKDLMRDLSEYHINLVARAKEELIAELGAASLCNFFNIQYKITQHESYLASWAKLLSDDDICSCIIQAEKIVNFVNKQFILLNSI